MPFIQQSLKGKIHPIGVRMVASFYLFFLAKKWCGVLHGTHPIIAVAMKRHIGVGDFEVMDS